jgi:hypothetical protein
MKRQTEITRFTTPEERANTAGIELLEEDLDHFMDLLRKGLIEAAAEHVTAVQCNFALSAEMSIRLSRPVRNDKGEVTELVGRNMLEGTIRARKIFVDPQKPPAKRRRSKK